MPVFRYRSIEEMPPPWRAADDPGNLRLAAQMLALGRRLQTGRPAGSAVQRFRTFDEAEAAVGDPYRQGHRER